jgi:hypothetical protein
MATVLDQSFSVGKESTYGTAVALARAYEVKTDGWKRQQESLPSVGMRPGMQGEGSDRQKTINMGGSGTTSWDVLNKGAGLLFQAMFGSATGPTQQASTIAYLSTFATTTAAPDDYFTTQIQRVDSGDTVRSFTAVGCAITGWKLAHEVGGLLTLDIDWDARDIGTATGAGSAVSPSSATTFDWTQLNVTVNGTETCLKSFELNADLGLKTDRRLMCSTSAGLKRAPKRAAVPTFTGSFVSEFDDLTLYNLYTAGTIVPIVATWTGAQIVSGHNYQITLTLPACKFDGDTPEASLTDMTMQPMQFRALYDQSSALATLTYKSTDTAL